MKSKYAAIAVLALIILAGGIYIFYMHAYNRTLPLAIIPEEKFEYATSPAPYDPIAAIATSKIGWKTYSNSVYGFRFEYPGDYEITVNAPEEGTQFSLLLAPKSSGALPENDTTTDESLRFFLSVHEGTVSEIISKYAMETYESVSLKEISLNDFIGRLIVSKYPLTGEFRNDILLNGKSGAVIHINYMQYLENHDQNAVSPDNQNSIFNTVLQSIRSYP